MQESQDPAAAALALQTLPVFAGLTPVARAKLAGVLEERWYEAGERVFESGTHGDALYVLFEGRAERRIAGATLDVLEPPAYFGELSLLTDEPRSATVIATQAAGIWVLPSARFHALLRAEPDLMLGLMNAVGQELARTRQLLGTLRRELDDWVTERLSVRTAQEREVIEMAAFFERPPMALLRRALDAQDAAGAARLASVGERTPLVHVDGETLYLIPAVRQSVLQILDRQHRRAELSARLRSAARALESEGAGDVAITDFLSAAPAHEGGTDRASADLAVAPGSNLATGSNPLSAVQAGHAPLPLPRSLAQRFPGGARGIWRLIALLPLLAWPLAPPEGLEPAGWHVLLSLVSAAVLFASEALPETAVALGLLGIWGLGNVVTPETALAGFATQTWLLVLTVLAVGAAVGGTGLLYRVALTMLGTRARGYAWRCLSLACIGTLVTPTLPNATSRMALAAPMVREIAEALGYQPGTRPAAGLALAALVGFGQMSMLFLTGASVGLLVHALLPGAVRAEFDFLGWFLAAAPLHAVLFALAMGTIIFRYRRGAAVVSSDRLALQRAVLGPISRGEKLCLGVLALLIVGFITEPLHGIAGAWIGVVAFVLLAAGGQLDAGKLRSGVNWGFLVFLGVITSLSGVFRELGIDVWFGKLLGGPVQQIAGNGMALCVALTLAGFLLSFFVRWQAAAPILTLVALPAAQTAGMNPFLVGLIALVSTQVWFLPFQSTVYMALHQGTGDLFSHRDVRFMAWAWGPMVLIAVVAAVPVWRLMGYLP